MTLRLQFLLIRASYHPTPTLPPPHLFLKWPLALCQLAPLQTKQRMRTECGFEHAHQTTHTQSTWSLTFFSRIHHRSLTFFNRTHHRSLTFFNRTHHRSLTFFNRTHHRSLTFFNRTHHRPVKHLKLLTIVVGIGDHSVLKKLKNIRYESLQNMLLLQGTVDK